MRIKCLDVEREMRSRHFGKKALMFEKRSD